MAYRSIATIKADIVRKFFGASGRGITVAVLASGIDGSHPHFRKYRNLELPPPLKHRDFTEIDGTGDPLKDEVGFGTSIAGLIAGELSAADSPMLAEERFQDEQGSWRTEETRLEWISGVAPEAKLVSYKVLDRDMRGQVSSVIAALREIDSVNDGRLLLIHAVCLPLGYDFDPQAFACGQSPLCFEVNRLVRSGVVVVVAAGNTGHGLAPTESRSALAGFGMTINDPGNADLAITVGSTHRDLPHLYGVSYFSSKGPTIDGRLKPDLVAPGERVISSTAGDHSVAARYRENSGTSTATAHVAGAVACLLSVRRDLIGQPEKVKEIFVNSATDLGRLATHQGRGLIDLLQAIQPGSLGHTVASAAPPASHAIPGLSPVPRTSVAAPPLSAAPVVPQQAREPEAAPLRLMYSYARVDKKLMKELDVYLSPLVREGLVTIWSDREIAAGEEWNEEIRRNLVSADIIVLLVSAYFISSTYVWSEEMKVAIGRHHQGSALVIPVIVSHVDWQKMPFAVLQVLPEDAKPVSSWQDQSEAWTNVVKGVRTAVERMRVARGTPERS